MSDPVQNSDVEDVLSSIRRLVSEEDRPAAKAPEPQPSDRLVLTPSLRVAEPVAPAEPEAEPDMVEDAGQAPVDAPETHALEDPVDDAPEAEAQPEAEEHADDQHAGDQHADDQHADDQHADDQHAGDQHAGDQTDDQTDDQPDGHAEAHEAADTEEHTFEDEGSAEAAQDDAAPEAENMAEHAEAEATEWPEAEDTAPEPEPAPEAEHAPEPAPEAEEVYTTPQSLSAKIAALEEVIARRDDQWEPDTAGADDYAGTEDADMTWEDAGADDPDGPEIFAVDEDVLDEDALRDLVADIVREELQGALGERITRNVRKLVRREIHRALAAQELD